MHGVRHVAVRGDDDGWRRVTAVAHLAEKVEAVHIRHAQIEDREIEGAGGKVVECLRPAVRFGDGIALSFQRHTVPEADVRFVVYD